MPNQSENLSGLPQPASQVDASSFEAFRVRRDELRAACRRERADAFAVIALPSVRYLSGFTGSNAALLITSDREILFTDSRYQTQAADESDCEIHIGKGSLIDVLAQVARKIGVTRLAFERNRISFDDHQRLVAARDTIRLKGLSQIVERLRLVKSPAEISVIRTSVDLNSAALEQALQRFKPGATELDLSAEIEYCMKRLGADGVAFETIAASGPRSALPHARPTANKIASDQLLLIDMGALVAGYASDMSRTFAVGKLKSSKARRMYRAVLEAQLAALDAVKPGVQAAAVDFAARHVLRRYGFDKLFIHSTGHGLGLEIHEAPRLGRREAARLEVGMVITIEPGVYLEGLGGVRIEDTVVVTPHGCEVLTPTTKELRSL
jgi:Xaa-Pro aminopeptidase